MAHILLTGSGGSIGKGLIPKLLSFGHMVHILSTNKNAMAVNGNVSFWNPAAGDIDQNALENIEILIHLAGASLAKPWTSNYRAEIRDSRIRSTQLLFDLAKSQGTLRKYIGMAATGIYPDPSNDELDENSGSGTGFVAELCIEWEAAHNKFLEILPNITIMRCAPVLMPKSGLLKAFLMTQKLRVIPQLGSEKNHLSWIHYQDLLAFIMTAVESDEYGGVYNLCSPQPATQKSFVEAVDSAMKKWHWHPVVPAMVLKLVFGERAVLPLTSQRVLPNALLKREFKFRYPDIGSALNHLLA